MLRHQITSILLPLLIAFSAAQAAEQVCDANGVCTQATCHDSNEECDTWSSQGECDANPEFMLKQCRKSCWVCGDDDFADRPGDGSSYGEAQIMGDENFFATEANVKERLARVNRYMEQTQVPDDIKAKCRNLHANCTNWAVGGE